MPLIGVSEKRKTRFSFAGSALCLGDVWKLACYDVGKLRPLHYISNLNDIIELNFEFVAKWRVVNLGNAKKNGWGEFYSSEKLKRG
ncbi:MAG: hypothetical protein II767_10635 [Proteobacteria bacterium]|nr:hypothetical protein [Pseudomonadota bacterium]